MVGVFWFIMLLKLFIIVFWVGLVLVGGVIGVGVGIVGVVVFVVWVFVVFCWFLLKLGLIGVMGVVGVVVLLLLEFFVVGVVLVLVRFWFDFLFVVC